MLSTATGYLPRSFTFHTQWHPHFRCRSKTPRVDAVMSVVLLSGTGLSVFDGLFLTLKSLVRLGSRRPQNIMIVLKKLADVKVCECEWKGTYDVCVCVVLVCELLCWLQNNVCRNVECMKKEEEEERRKIWGSYTAVVRSQDHCLSK